jgi:hypothetical protein
MSLKISHSRNLAPTFRTDYEPPHTCHYCGIGDLKLWLLCFPVSVPPLTLLSYPSLMCQANWCHYHRGCPVELSALFSGILHFLCAITFCVYQLMVNFNQGNMFYLWKPNYPTNCFVVPNFQCCHFMSTYSLNSIWLWLRLLPVNLYSSCCVYQKIKFLTNTKFAGWGTLRIEHAL